MTHPVHRTRAQLLRKSCMFVVRLSLGTAASLAAAAGTEAKTLYKDAKAPVEARVEDLLFRMSLEEKIAQITAVWNRKAPLLTSSGEFDPAKARQLYPDGIGHFVRPSDLHGAGPPTPYEKPFRDVRQTIALVNAVLRRGSAFPRYPKRQR